MINPGASFDGQHTQTNFHMIPKRVLVFAPPPPKLITEEIKGASGEMDYTEALTQKIVYGNRKGSFEFLVENGQDYMSVYESCLTFFDGTRRICILDDDPHMHYEGRFWVSKWQSWKDYSLIVIDYNVRPYRYSEDNIQVHDWEWDTMSFVDDDPLLYGNFSVDESKARTLVNLGEADVHPIITCSAAMEATVDGITYQFPAGQAVTADFALSPGETEIVFFGTGTVALDYSLETEL